MPPPFPGMDPFVEGGDIFYELRTQMLCAAQGSLQPQLLLRYIAKLEGDGHQRTIAIYTAAKSRVALTCIDFLSPLTKDSDYAINPPPPLLSEAHEQWLDALLRAKGLRK